MLGGHRGLAAAVSPAQAKILSVGAHRAGAHVQPAAAATRCEKIGGHRPAQPVQAQSATGGAAAGPTLLKPKPPPPPEHLTALKWEADPRLPDKVYEGSPNPLPARATTLPNRPSTWAKLTWSLQPAGGGAGSAGATADLRSVPVPAAGDHRLKVTLTPDGAPPEEREIPLHVRRWPELELIALAFDSLQVLNDGTAKFGKKFDKRWEAGRKDPDAAPATPTAQYQSLLAYARKTKVKVTATFRVKKQPLDPETVEVFGKATLSDGSTLDWKTNVTVNPGDAEVKTLETTSTTALPDKVMLEAGFSVVWEQAQPEGGPKTPAGASKNTLYVLLGAPKSKLYWTLLELSCSKGRDKTTEAAFVPEAFKAFTGTTGDGNGFRRKGDGVETSYYRFGAGTPSSGNVFLPEGILSRSDGTGRCGAWAKLLIHMLEMHGVTGARVLGLVPGPGLKARDSDILLLVRKLDFKAPGKLPGAMKAGGLYTHDARSEVDKLDGIAGQGKTNPQFLFGDHAAVGYGGQIYDPSYGVGPVGGAVAYEAGAIAGFGSQADFHDFNCADGTKQFIPVACCKGFAPVAGTTFDAAAAAAGCTAAELWNDSINQDAKAAATLEYNKLAAPAKAATTPQAVSTAGHVIYAREPLVKTPMLVGY